MSRCRSFLLCALPALSSVLLASNGGIPLDPASSSTTDPANEPGVPAHFSWADVDGDGRLDLAVVGAGGKLQLLTNAGDGQFEDATERVGLSDVRNAAFALWADYDGDGRLDLFVGAREGASRLFHNEGDFFIDMSAGSGLASEGPVQSAQWFDHDADGRLDLFVVKAERNVLFRGLEGGFFEPAELPLAGAVNAPGLGGAPVEAEGDGTPSVPGSSNENGGSLAGRSIGGSPTSIGLNAPGGSITLLLPPSPGTSCLDSVRNQANPSPSACIKASTTPTLGKLHPITANLFVAIGGNVGIGTTSPAARLDVAGTARMTGTLTLDPGVDQALDVSTGSIYKSGALFIHTKGGTGNTALGREALASPTSGYNNTASGMEALFSNTGGYNNTAIGMEALFSNTDGASNTAGGFRALYSNTDGVRNTASGTYALFSNTTGSLNTATGYGALQSNTTGNTNTANGYRALYSDTTGQGNTASGHRALNFNTTGNFNTASGIRALYSNTTGFRNTASGYRALFFNTTGNNNTVSGSRALLSNTTGSSNIALGYAAGYDLTTGSRNIAIGNSAGSNLTTGDDNIAIGNSAVAGEGATIRIGKSVHTRAFIAGIRGVATGVANAIPVLVDSAGQLGTVSSSRRFKKDIADMGELTDRLLDLRPVVFHYKQEQKLPNGGELPLEYGLIAEEVAEIFPDLVVYDEEGLPFTVKYHLLSSMLLNEVRKLDGRLDEQDSQHSRELDEVRSRLASLEARNTLAPLTAVHPAGD